MFKNLFGGGKKDKPKIDANVDGTIQNLDKKINDMELLLKNYEVRTNALQEEAKQKIRQGDKNGAKRILAKKKKIVDQIKQTEGALMMMEEQKVMLENARGTKELIETIKGANDVIKANKVDVEELDRIKEEMDEQKAANDELKEFFTDYADQNTEDVEDDLKDLELELEKESEKILPSANKENIISNGKNKVKNDEQDLEAFMKAI